MRHLTVAELEAGLPHIRQSPADDGVLRLIVRRPNTGEREELETGELDVADGLVGDMWKARASKRANGGAYGDTQVNIMNARAIALIAGDPDRWALAGDQLFVDLDLSGANVPPGTRLAIGSAIVQITEPPHTGCSKFAFRFGGDARTFVNSPVGRELSLRGLNAKVVRPGVVRAGDAVRKI
jgi:MOSC domain-containing protein YiiM